MLILPDNDVGGAAAALRFRLESADWADLFRLLGVRFTSFEEMGLPRNAPDRAVWQACQAADAILLTANRTGGSSSLDETIRDLSGPSSLPVVTIADPQRLLHDSAYREAATIRLLDYLERVESLRGTGRLFVP